MKSVIAAFALAVAVVAAAVVDVVVAAVVVFLHDCSTSLNGP